VRVQDGSGELSFAAILGRRATPYALALLLCGAAITAGLTGGYDVPAAANLIARWTARAALPLFLATYTASSLLRRWPSPATKALVRNRRHWGLGFALAHTIHLIALGVNISWYNPRPLDTLSGGAAAYAILYLMVLTSTDAAQRAMGKGWKWLHRIGIHYIWLVFLVAYGGRAVGHDPTARPEGIIASALLLGALGLRVAVWLRARQSVAKEA
jgi:methionine sulfoxide reductase heme-binding subunit